jgi:hypothetical protein
MSGAIAPIFLAFFASARLEPVVRVDRILDLSADDGRSFWVGGIGGAAWYRVGRAWPWTIDLDAQGAAYVEVRWAGSLMAPINCEAIVESDDGTLAVSDLVVAADYSRFMVTGSGGYVTLNVEAGGLGEKDVIRLRIRAKVPA